MNLIVVIDEEWGIGCNSSLLFRLPVDMKFFKNMTMGKTIVMGKTTLMSLPGGKPLKGRENVVLTRDLNYKQDDVVVCHNIGEVLEYCKNKDTFIIGGAQTYDIFLPYCKRAFVTKVKAHGAADKFFDNLDNNKNWQLKVKSGVIKDGDYNIQFCTYDNLKYKMRENKLN